MSDQLDTPLLESEYRSSSQLSCVNGCPGCALELRKAATKDPPRKELCILALIMLSTALPMSSLFPFLYFMVRDFHITTSDTQIGSYAGYIGSAIMFGRFLTSAPWGMVADKYGRKPVLIIGTAAVVVFNTLFGFSKNFWLALAARFLLGISNGVMVTVPVYASEVCNEEHRPLGLSIVGTMWGLGLIIGPAIGGYLAQPAEKYPTLFPSGSLFDTFPYALPCLCISLLATMCLVTSFWLPETYHIHKDAIDKKGGSNHAEKKSNDIESENTKGQTVELRRTETSSKKKPLWKNHGLIAATFVYCIWGLHDMAYSELFSLWAVSPKKYGGLAFTTSEVGDVLAVSGAALLLFQLLLFPSIARMLGAIRISRYPTLLTIPLVVVYPLIARLSGAGLWVGLMLASVIKNLLSVCVVTGSFIMLNNSVMTAQRGVANGAATSFLSLFRTLGPAGAGVLLSCAEQRMDASFLPGMWMVFFILGVLAFLSFVSTFEPILPKSVDKQVSEPERTSSKDDDLLLKRAASFTV